VLVLPATNTLGWATHADPWFCVVLETNSVPRVVRCALRAGVPLAHRFGSCVFVRRLRSATPLNSSFSPPSRSIFVLLFFRFCYTTACLSPPFLYSVDLCLYACQRSPPARPTHPLRSAELFLNVLPMETGVPFGRALPPNTASRPPPTCTPFLRLFIPFLFFVFSFPVSVRRSSCNSTARTSFGPLEIMSTWLYMY